MRAVFWGVALGSWIVLGTYCIQAQEPVAAVVIEKENVVEMQLHRGKWEPARTDSPLADRDKIRTGEFSRAAVRFADLSILRVDELSLIEILTSAAKPALGVKSGGIYLLNRDHPQSIEIRTAAANAAIRGTEFALRVTPGGQTLITMFEGEVELSNPQGRILLRSGEQGVAEAGSAPRKTAVIDAINTIQWCLYYPAVLDPAEFGAALSDKSATALTAYRKGDLLGALRTLPTPRAGESPQTRLLRAATILSVGQVEKARRILTGLPRSVAGARALDRMIDAVQHRENKHAPPPLTSSDWLAESYYLQSRHDLPGALTSARRATELSPDFGLAWAHLAEIEFSFGRLPRAMQLIERSLELAPLNAQAVALQGFLLAAENRTGAAHRSFEQAIALDGALGNAWLGRGLTAIRQGREAEGRRDLQIAATLEPTRAFLRSYLGKAFSDAGPIAKATAEFDRAKALDPADPTPWLYSALELQRQNRPNEAIAELEKSIALNDQRRLYRSQFLLDQDRAIRGANLASIYRQAGMAEQSVREAIRAVASDYTSAQAHLFLSSSYDSLRDPTRVLLRYETGWFNELLLANLLSPVGGGALSQYVSQQEYSKLFEQDGSSSSAIAEYRGNGELRATASQFGTSGNLGYAIDTEYLFNDGLRPNNRVAREEAFGTFKLQLGSQDTVLFQTKLGSLRTGDLYQRYDPRDVSFTRRSAGRPIIPVENRAALTSDYHEEQFPALLLLGWHHEWSASNHTLIIASRLGASEKLATEDAAFPIVVRDVSPFVPPEYEVDVGLVIPRDADFFDQMKKNVGRGRVKNYFEGGFDLDYRAELELFGGEIQHIFTLGPSTLIAGGKFQSGEFDTHSRLTDYLNNRRPDEVPLFLDPPAKQQFSVNFERISIYLYETWRFAPWLSVTGGVTYDHLTQPDNFRSPPLNGRTRTLEHVSPKIGLLITPWSGATVRAAYATAINGASFDESVRLEPTQVAGFLQAYRTVASESLIGGVSGSEFRFSGISIEQRLPTHTYLGVEFRRIEQDVDRTIGVFDQLDIFGTILAILPSSLLERDRYREDSLTATINQLVGDYWTFGLRYRFTYSELDRTLDGFDAGIRASRSAGALPALTGAGRARAESSLQELNIQAAFHHPSGWFARAEANWYGQENDEFFESARVEDGRVSRRRSDRGQSGDDFWQFNLLGGHRFARNRCEISCGVLNLTGEDYRLSPLNPYVELVRDRTFVVRARLEF